jgi:PadR family transcriptional regulator PadR
MWRRVVSLSQWKQPPVRETLPPHRANPLPINQQEGIDTTFCGLYVVLTHMGSQTSDRELKKGSAELLILSLLESRARHGYEIAKLIERRSGGALSFHVASLYPLLYRLEARGWIQGRWIEKAGQRRRRYYRLTGEGRKVLAAQRRGWRQFVKAMRLITGIDYA